MSCNGCRVLRKGCSDACVLRPSIEWIDGAQPQANATVFVAKFFGRAGLVASLASGQASLPAASLALGPVLTSSSAIPNARPTSHVGGPHLPCRSAKK